MAKASTLPVSALAAPSAPTMLSKNKSSEQTPKRKQQQQPNQKKRRIAGNPDPDAEVVALSPESLLATNRFVCEVCNKGFQRDQNLQLHRRGHNLPWKLARQRSGARRRVYVCPEGTCIHHDPSRALGDLTGIKKHYCRKHGEKLWLCHVCHKSYAVTSDWKAHLKVCGFRAHKCQCGVTFNQNKKDEFIAHRAFCQAMVDLNITGEVGAEVTVEVSDEDEIPPNANPAASDEVMPTYPDLNDASDQPSVDQIGFSFWPQTVSQVVAPSITVPSIGVPEQLPMFALGEPFPTLQFASTEAPPVSSLYVLPDSKDTIGFVNGPASGFNHSTFPATRANTNAYYAVPNYELGVTSDGRLITYTRLLNDQFSPEDMVRLGMASNVDKPNPTPPPPPPSQASCMTRDFLGLGEAMLEEFAALHFGNGIGN